MQISRLLKIIFLIQILANFLVFQEPEPDSFNVAWVNVIKLENTDIIINDLMKEIMDDGIDLRNLFYPSE